jgi:hypothetical protein
MNRLGASEELVEVCTPYAAPPSIGAIPVRFLVDRQNRDRIDRIDRIRI